MSGALWAAIAGVGFGIFQALNGKAVRDLRSIYLSTFLQLLVAAVVLSAAALATEDLADLGGVPARSAIAFALAGIVHFFLGWTTLNLSQARIGAVRTGPLLSTTPLFGLVLAGLLAAQVPGWVAVGGIVLTIVGAYLVTDPGGELQISLRESSLALATAAAWALSAVLILEGLEGLDSPLLGVAIGIWAGTLAYGALLLVLPAAHRDRAGAFNALTWKMLAGVIVGLATWGRWVALEDTAVAVVLALNLISVPVVLVLSPVFAGRHVEVVTGRVWGGAALIMAGSLLLLGTD